MMERLLERVSVSNYRNNFIIKGGMLITALVGVSLRSTMEIDTSLENLNLSEADARRIITEIKDIDIGDGITFKIRNAESIMDEMEYPGIRITMDAIMCKLVIPIKVDISTGDIITPQPVEYRYKLLLEDRYINLMSYKSGNGLGGEDPDCPCKRNFEYTDEGFLRYQNSFPDVWRSA